MNIVYSASDLYSSLAGISIQSLLENNKQAKEINIYIMDNGISNANKEKLYSMVNGYGRNLVFFPLSEKLTKENINIQRWNISTFGRLFEASSLPEHVKKVIHIDCDTVIDGSIEPLWELDLSNAVVAGALECLSDKYKINIGMNPEDSYINAGNIVINLERIRELNLEEKFLEYIKSHSRLLTYVDQEVLNACVPESEKVVFPLKFNAYSILFFLDYKQLKKLRRVNHMFSIKEYEEAKKEAVIIHYTTCFLDGSRPWIEGNQHPRRNTFLKYKEMSPWADMPLWKDNRSKKQRFISTVVHLMPKVILVPLVSLVHGVIVPLRNKKLQG